MYRALAKDCMENIAAARSGFGGVFAASEAGGGPQLGPNHFGIGAGCRRSLRRRRARLLRKRLAFHKKLYLRGVDDFALEQRLRDAFEHVAVTGKSVARPFVGGADDAPHFLIDLDGSVFGIVAVLS